MIIAKIRSLRWADFFLFALLDPRLLYRQIAANDPRPFALSFAVPAMAAISEILASSLMGKETSFFYFKITYGWILIFIYTAVKIIISCSLIDLIAQFLGHKGNVREIVSLANYSLFPQLFILPLTYIFVIINFAPVVLYVMISLALFIWSCIIVVMGLAEMHSINTGRAVLLLLFPYIFVGASIFFIALLLVLGLVNYIT